MQNNSFLHCQHRGSLRPVDGTNHMTVEEREAALLIYWFN